MYEVLLVDDEEIILEGLSKVIEWNKYGCRICAMATSGEEGVEFIKELQPDIIITDIRMKNMSGLEMLEATKAEIKDAQIIILTGYREFEYAQKAIYLGVSEFILKPTKMNDIILAVKNVTAKLDEARQNALMEESLLKQIELLKAEKGIDELVAEEDDALYLPTDKQTVKTFISVIVSGDEEQFARLYSSFEQKIKTRSIEEVNALVKSIIFKIYDANKIINDKYPEVNKTFLSEMIDKNTEIADCVSVFYDIATDMIRKIDKYNNAQHRIKLRNAVEYIDKNYFYPITRNEIAEYVHVSPNYLSAIFRSEMDISYIEYLNQVRIKHAKELLIESDKKLHEIADEIGYGDVYYFSKVFKQHMGISPNEYRKKHKKLL